MRELSIQQCHTISGASPAMAFTATFLLAHEYDAKFAISTGFLLGTICYVPTLPVFSQLIFTWSIASCFVGSLAGYTIYQLLEND